MPPEARVFAIHLDTGDWPVLEILYRREGLVAIRPVRGGAGPPAGRPPGWLERLLADLSAYLGGEARDFAYVPLCLEGLTEFQRAVIEEMRRIPFGQRKTYGEMARALEARGMGASPRAVGQACARNPFPLVVPCHRVTYADGGLGGFTAPGGVDLKRRMLALEGLDAGVC